MSALPVARRRPARRSAVALLLLCAATVRAQCPDGTPPPCKGSVQAATLRRLNPPLNLRAWIVVPFGNVMKAQELDWLRDASVNLLTMDLGRWTDLNIVPDKRVGDLIRELPGGARVLTLNDGLAVARRAGASNLVMGDFFRLGKGARLVANVFDVRTGNKLRSVVQVAPEQDSLLTAFAPLARGVLAVAAPPDTKLGEVGTSNLDAYQAYLLGVQALNRFNLPEARLQLNRALALDSTFALAHLELSLALGWGEQSLTASEGRRHALAAARLGRSLPPRERAFIAARVAAINNDFAGSCAAIAPLAARDSTDVNALYQLGECAFHDNTVDLSPTDSTRGTFRWSWNTSVRSLSRVLDLDPNYHLAFEHILDVNRADMRTGCARKSADALCRHFTAIVLRDGDSLLTQPMADDIHAAAWRAQIARAVKEAPQLVNLSKARQLAERPYQNDRPRTSSRAPVRSYRLHLARERCARRQWCS